MNHLQVGSARVSVVIRAAIATVATVFALGGCALPSGPQPMLATYDLGPAQSLLQTPAQGAATAPILPSAARAGAATRPILIVSDVNAPTWLDNPYIYYRLAFADLQQPRPYAQSRWTMPPAQLLSQRVRMRLGRFAYVVAAGETTEGVVLKFDLDDFSQLFETQESSRAVVVLRASLISQGRLIGQRSFAMTRSAPSANAAGGVRALTEATDAVLEEVVAWLAILLK